MRMLRKLAIAVVLLAALAFFISYNVWRADQEPVVSSPGPLELGRQHLHQQLLQAQQQEAQVEKQAWNSPAQLRFLLQAHQQRLAKLTGNSQAGEIVAYDQASIARLQKRIDDLAAQAAAQAAQAAAQPTTQPAASSAHPRP